MKLMYLDRMPPYLSGVAILMHWGPTCALAYYSCNIIAGLSQSGTVSWTYRQCPLLDPQLRMWRILVIESPVYL